MGLWWKVVPYLAGFTSIALVLAFKASLLFYWTGCCTWNGSPVGRFSVLRVQKSKAAAHSTASEGAALMSGVVCVVSRRTSVGEKKKKQRYLLNNR